MAHYALLDENNIVTQVFVGKNENEVPEGYTSNEDYYKDLFGQECKQTSYNTVKNQHKRGGTPLRYNYAGIGFSYNPEADAFIAPQPFDSWTLNTDCYCWEAPIPMPQDENVYFWNEESSSWEAFDTSEQEQPFCYN